MAIADLAAAIKQAYLDSGANPAWAGLDAYALNVATAIWNYAPTGDSGAPLTNTAPADVTKATAAVGVSTEAARSDHKHNVSTASASSLSPGGANAEGTSTSLARADHTHALPAFGSSAGTFCQGNDTRLSDARTPTAHAASHAPGGADALAVDAAAGTGSLRTLGTGALQAAPGNHTHAAAAPVWACSLLDMISGGSDLAVGSGSGNYTIGTQFIVHKTSTITGVRFATPSSWTYPKTITVKLWTAAGVALATASASVAAAGVHTISFATPYVVTGNKLGYRLAVSMREDGAAAYPLVTGTVPESTPSTPFIALPQVLCIGTKYYAAGDYCPNTAASSERYAVEPVFS